MLLHITVGKTLNPVRFDMAKDWIAWHAGYDDSESELSHRLRVVVPAIRTFLDESPPGAIRVLSLCAGDARDLAQAVSGDPPRPTGSQPTANTDRGPRLPRWASVHMRAKDLIGAVVELDPGLARLASENLMSLSKIRVLTTDAGNITNFSEYAPVDLLLLCGIFGNISDQDIEQTISAVSALCRPNATVIWTRHRRVDITTQIRSWFAAANCESVALLSPGEGKFAVGVERFSGPTAPLPTNTSLFTFRDLW